MNSNEHERMRPWPLRHITIVLLVLAAGGLASWCLLLSQLRFYLPVPDVQNIEDTHAAAHEYLTTASDGEIPASWVIIIRRGDLPPAALYSSAARRTSCWPSLSSGERKFAEPSLVEMTDAMLESEIAKDPPTGPWERMGEVVMSREVAAYTSGRSALVAGHFLVAGEHLGQRGSGLAAFVFADGTARYLKVTPAGEESGEYEATVAADRAAREELDLSEPPDYAAVIREYVESQKQR